MKFVLNMLNVFQFENILNNLLNMSSLDEVSTCWEIESFDTYLFFPKQPGTEIEEFTPEPLFNWNATWRAGKSNPSQVGGVEAHWYLHAHHGNIFKNMTAMIGSKIVFLVKYL